MFSLLPTHTDESTPLFLSQVFVILILAVFRKIQVTFQ